MGYNKMVLSTYPNYFTQLIASNGLFVQEFGPSRNFRENHQKIGDGIIDGFRHSYGWKLIICITFVCHMSLTMQLNWLIVYGDRAR